MKPTLSREQWSMLAELKNTDEWWSLIQQRCPNPVVWISDLVEIGVLGLTQDNYLHFTIKGKKVFKRDAKIYAQ